MRAALGALLLVGVLLLAGSASGQGHFRISHTSRGPEAGFVTLEGRVFNDTNVDVLDVWVTAKGLGPTGGTLTTGITFILLIPRHGSATFEAKVPAAEGIRDFQLAVTSYREGEIVRPFVQSP